MFDLYVRHVDLPTGMWLFLLGVFRTNQNVGYGVRRHHSGNDYLPFLRRSLCIRSLSALTLCCEGTI